MDITADHVRQAAERTTSISQLARALGIKEKKVSGRTGRRLRALLPNLDEILKANREAVKTSTGSAKRKPLKAESPSANPYREGSSYYVLFQEGSKQFWDKSELLERASRMTGKSQRVLAFALAVIANPNQQSNQSRSKASRDDRGRIRLVALKQEG